MEPATENRRLQTCINDLSSVTALSAMWTGRGAAEVVGTLLDALVRMLGLEFACARVKLEAGGSDVEMIRLGDSPPSPGAERRIARALDGWLAQDAERWPARV